ncbi:MAG: hypothetical protein ACLQEI_05965 [Terriglobales bacterium]|jgi:hypothetical protein
MATGTVTALEPIVETNAEAPETCEAQPATLTLKDRIARLFRTIFEEHEENLTPYC